MMKIGLVAVERLPIPAEICLIAKTNAPRYKLVFRIENINSCFHSLPLGSRLPAGAKTYAYTSIIVPAIKNLIVANTKGSAAATPYFVATEAEAHNAANKTPGKS